MTKTQRGSTPRDMRSVCHVTPTWPLEQRGQRGLDARPMLRRAARPEPAPRGNRSRAGAGGQAGGHVTRTGDRTGLWRRPRLGLRWGGGADGNSAERRRAPSTHHPLSAQTHCCVPMARNSAKRAPEPRAGRGRIPGTETGRESRGSPHEEAVCTPPDAGTHAGGCMLLVGGPHQTLSTGMHTAAYSARLRVHRPRAAVGTRRCRRHAAARNARQEPRPRGERKKEEGGATPRRRARGGESGERQAGGRPHLMSSDCIDVRPARLVERAAAPAGPMPFKLRESERGSTREEAGRGVVM